MKPLTDEQKEGRKQAALVREAHKRTAWVFNPRFPAWAYCEDIPEGGTLRRIEKIHINEPIPDERG